MVKPYVMEGDDTDQEADHNNQSREKEERQLNHLRGKSSSPDETEKVSMSELFRKESSFRQPNHSNRISTEHESIVYTKGQNYRLDVKHRREKM